MKKFWMIAGVIVLTASGAAQARMAYDPMRCEALMLQRESKMHKCLSRCELRASRRSEFDAAGCDETCHARYDRAVERLQRRAACTPPTPDPHQCEAQALKVEARHLICQSSCERKGDRPEFSVSECKTVCDDWCDTALDEVLVGPICGEGRSAEDAPVGDETDE